ncbi:MAG: hypothetical protein AAFR93_14455 [Pseudomonadota bacterium]
MRCLMMTAALAFCATHATAQATGERVRTLSNGETFTTNVEAERGDQSRTVTSTGSGSAGAGYDRTAVWTWDRDTQSWTKSVTGETARGKTWTNTGSGNCVGGECASSSTVVGADGRTSTRSATRSRGEGTITHDTKRGTRAREWRRVR